MNMPALVTPFDKNDKIDFNAFEKHMITPVIMAGGTGSRLWPLSREHYPKQFLTANSRCYSRPLHVYLVLSMRHLF